jgi:hypothetical protein
MHRVPARFSEAWARLRDPHFCQVSEVFRGIHALHAPKKWSVAAGVTHKQAGRARTSLPDASPSHN